MSKKLYLFLSVAVFAFVLSSCSKNQCKNCTITTEPDCEVVVCNNTITFVGNCSLDPINTAGMTNDDIVDSLESLGYVCVRP